MKKLLYIFVLLLTMTSCYREKRPTDNHDALPVEGTNALSPEDSTKVADSISFYTQHHYSIGYNFLVHKDSLVLIVQQPEEHVSQLVTDSFAVKQNQRIAVMDIRTVPQDSVDSIWLEMITEDGQSGWIHESALLPKVVPTDPISQCIMYFSDKHIMYAAIIVGLMILAYSFRVTQKRRAHIVHFNDIPSFYPTLLCLIVACSATFYASLQMFGADTWRHFYYHPTLNPFNVPLILGIFISTVWGMLIVGIACIEDVRHHLPLDEAILYIASLIGVCGVLYIIFSLTTLYYVGYPLLVAYCWFAIRRYQPFHTKHYVCGNCGKRIYEKGECPHCGAINE